MKIQWTIGFVLLTAASLAAAEVRIENGWVRAVPPVSDATAGYARIVNAGDTAVTIAAAGVDWAGGAMLHDSGETGDGTRSMRHIGPVELAPGDALVLKPGGKHWMFTDVKRVPKDGERVPVCLKVDGKRQCTELPVRRSAPE